MRPHIAIFDDFFADPTDTLKQLRQAGFRDVVSEWDGVTYPGICQMGNHIFAGSLRKILGHEIETVATFARLTSAQEKPAPNQIHPDTVMSQYALLIYMSEKWPAGSGTSFWDHKTEGRYHTELTNHETVKRDSNDRTQWLEYFRTEAKQNRALLYDSRLYHCAEPVGGFGSGPEDGRIVITSFFNIVE